MKPCSSKRKPIALLALGEAEARHAETLRVHLQSCEGCRHYFEEVSAVTERMAVVATAPELEASPAFHRKLVVRLRLQESASGRKIAGRFGALLNWRVALPVAAIGVILMIGLRVPRQTSGTRLQPTTPMPGQTASASDANADVLPTIANYQMALNQSLQKFDELLNQEAKLEPPPAPVYNASVLALADMSQ